MQKHTWGGCHLPLFTYCSCVWSWMLRCPGQILLRCYSFSAEKFLYFFWLFVSSFMLFFCIGFIPLFWGHPPMSWMSKSTTIQKLRPIFFSWNLLCKKFCYKDDYMMLMMLYLYCLHLPLLIKIKFVYAYVGPGSSQPPCQTGSGLGSWWRLGCEPGCPLDRKHGLS